MRIEKLIDEMIPISDAVIEEEMRVVTATRNAIDVRKWVASKLMPNQYGDAPASVSIHNNTNVLSKRRVTPQPHSRPGARNRA